MSADDAMEPMYPKVRNRPEAVPICSAGTSRYRAVWLALAPAPDTTPNSRVATTTQASGIKRWLTYAFGAGQKTLGSGSGQLPYAPLPSTLVAKDQTQLATMTCNGSPIS